MLPPKIEWASIFIFSINEYASETERVSMFIVEILYNKLFISWFIL